MSLFFSTTGPDGSYSLVADILSLLGNPPAKAVFYDVRPATLPAEAQHLSFLLWSGDVLSIALDGATASRPLVSALLSDFPMAIAGPISISNKS